MRVSLISRPGLILYPLLSQLFCTRHPPIREKPMGLFPSIQGKPSFNFICRKSPQAQGRSRTRLILRSFFSLPWDPEASLQLHPFLSSGLQSPSSERSPELPGETSFSTWTRACGPQRLTKEDKNSTTSTGKLTQCLVYSTLLLRNFPQGFASCYS